MGRPPSEVVRVKAYLTTFRNRESAVQLFKLVFIGGFNTILTFAIFNVFLFLGVRASISSAIAWTLTIFTAYYLNRRWTFGLQSGASSMETGRFFMVNAAAFVITAGALELGEWLLNGLSTLEANLIQLAMAGVLVFPKLAAYRDAVFRINATDSA